MARIPDAVHPRCRKCDTRMRPLYYTPIDTPVKKRAVGMWYCLRCNDVYYSPTLIYLRRY